MVVTNRTTESLARRASVMDSASETLKKINQPRQAMAASVFLVLLAMTPYTGEDGARKALCKAARALVSPTSQASSG